MLRREIEQLIMYIDAIEEYIEYKSEYDMKLLFETMIVITTIVFAMLALRPPFWGSDLLSYIGYFVAIALIWAIVISGSFVLNKGLNKVSVMNKDLKKCMLKLTSLKIYILTEPNFDEDYVLSELKRIREKLRISDNPKDISH